MIAPIALAVSLCIAPKITNKTPDWVDADRETLVFVENRCTKIYNDSPCLIEFIKTDVNTYRVLCGSISIRGMM